MNTNTIVAIGVVCNLLVVALGYAMQQGGLRQFMKNLAERLDKSDERQDRAEERLNNHGERISSLEGSRRLRTQ